MKPKQILILILSIIEISAFGQNDSLKAKFADKSVNAASMNEKSIFENYITGVAELFSTNSGTLSIQGNLYGIGKIFSGKAKDSLDYNYIKDAFWRNTQFNFSVIPDKKQVSKIDTSSH